MTYHPSFSLGISEDDLLNCTRCGTCLPVCPTYKIEPNETATPRGRLALMKATQDGILQMNDIASSLDMCLGCRACELACPSGVNYGHILEQARDVISSNTNYSIPVKIIRKVFLDTLLPHPKRMRWVKGGLRIYQKSGLQKIVRKSGILKVMPWHMDTFESVLPDVGPMFLHLPDKIMPESTKHNGEKPLIAFFTGCIQDTMFHETNRNTMKLLKASGYPVIVPDGQTCCGAIHAHAGETDKAKKLAKKNIEMLEREKADYLVNNQGGCGAMMKEYDKLLEHEPEWAERAKEFVKKVKDINEILALVDELPDLKPVNEVITYQDSCHLLNVQGVKYQPRQLIQSIPGVQFVEMVGAGTCCGSAGTYNMTHHEHSMKILDAKMVNVQATRATTVVVANPGCLLQMRIGIKRAGLEGKVRAVHIVDLLAEALKEEVEIK